ncbi:MAG: hypothetical protein KG028_13650 [Actinobacteria bacterium]|jgi:hypothetical protein|nr:hypothetical protein [Actinomycetota bacterium]
MGTADDVWDDFDQLVANADTVSPWAGADNDRRFAPDLGLLARLLAVPLRHGTASRTGLPAKAIDVWLSAELRRAGFDPDAVWPRPVRPRVMPAEIARLLEVLPRNERERLLGRLSAARSPAGVVSSESTVLGKAYHKQVDVVMASWARGPELLVSTKRMDSSFSNNLLNRIEESYGDAKNLRARHPLAVLGYVFAVRSTVMDSDRLIFERLKDLLQKLAEEDDAYDATALAVLRWDDSAVSQAGFSVEVVADVVPDTLRIGRFLGRAIDLMLARTPVDLHVLARERREGRRIG